MCYLPEKFLSHLNFHILVMLSVTEPLDFPHHSSKFSNQQLLHGTCKNLIKRKCS